MHIRFVTEADADTWLAMRAALRPEATLDELRAEVTGFFAASGDRSMLYRAFVAETEGGVLVGVLELSLRPYADGCASSPVPFIEGRFVVPEARRRGIGGALV